MGNELRTKQPHESREPYGRPVVYLDRTTDAPYITGMHTVIETPDYLREASKYGLDEEDRAELVTFLASEPDAGQPIPGTGGYRKLRLAGRGKGKSGGYRVITFFTGPNIPVFLITIYSKGEQDDLSPSQKRTMMMMSKTLVASYERKRAVRRR